MSLRSAPPVARCLGLALIWVTAVKGFRLGDEDEAHLIDGQAVVLEEASVGSPPREQVKARSAGHAEVNQTEEHHVKVDLPKEHAKANRADAVMDHDNPVFAGLEPKAIQRFESEQLQTETLAAKAFRRSEEEHRVEAERKFESEQLTMEMKEAKAFRHAEEQKEEQNKTQAKADKKGNGNATFHDFEKQAFQTPYTAPEEKSFAERELDKISVASGLELAARKQVDSTDDGKKTEDFAEQMMSFQEESELARIAKKAEAAKAAAILEIGPGDSSVPSLSHRGASAQQKTSKPSLKMAATLLEESDGQSQSAEAEEQLVRAVEQAEQARRAAKLRTERDEAVTPWDAATASGEAGAKGREAAEVTLAKVSQLAAKVGFDNRHNESAPAESENQQEEAAWKLEQAKRQEQAKAKARLAAPASSSSAAAAAAAVGVGSAAAESPGAIHYDGRPEVESLHQLWHEVDPVGRNESHVEHKVLKAAAAVVTALTEAEKAKRESEEKADCHAKAHQEASEALALGKTAQLDTEAKIERLNEDKASADMKVVQLKAKELDASSAALKARAAAEVQAIVARDARHVAEAEALIAQAGKDAADKKVNAEAAHGAKEANAAKPEEAAAKKQAIITDMFRPARAGDKKVEVESVDGFSQGDTVLIGCEEATIAGLDSFQLLNPLTQDHSAGTPVAKKEAAPGHSQPADPALHSSSSTASPLATTASPLTAVPVTARVSATDLATASPPQASPRETTTAAPALFPTTVASSHLSSSTTSRDTHVSQILNGMQGSTPARKIAGIKDTEDPPAQVKRDVSGWFDSIQQTFSHMMKAITGKDVKKEEAQTD